MSRVRMLFVNPQDGSCTTGAAAYRSLEALYQGVLGKVGPGPATAPVLVWVVDRDVKIGEIRPDTPTEARYYSPTDQYRVHYQVMRGGPSAKVVVEPAPAPPSALPRWRRALWMFEKLPRRYQEVSTLVISRDGRHQSWGRSHANPVAFGLAKPKKKVSRNPFIDMDALNAAATRATSRYGRATEARTPRRTAPQAVGEIPTPNAVPAKPALRIGVWA